MHYLIKHKIHASSFLFLFVILLSAGALAHSTEETNSAYVRVVSADSDSRTYTFSCSMDPDNDYLRDFFIRPDSGDFNEYIENEAEILDVAAGEDITYTFETEGFYHVGCVIVNSSDFSQQFRGDLHIDLRENDWNPQINFIDSTQNSIELSCDYSGSEYSAKWEVLNAQTGELTHIGNSKVIQHSVSGHGLYDYICTVNSAEGSKTTGMPIEFFDSGEPYYADEFGIPKGITNNWIRGEENSSEEENHTHQIYHVSEGEDIPSISFEVKNDSENYYLEIVAENISIVEKPDQEHVQGEAHIHWYLDSVKQGRIYSNYFDLPTISAGVHEITLTFSTNDHREYYYEGERIEYTQNFEIILEETGEDNSSNDLTGLNLISQNNLGAIYLCKPEGSSDDLVVDWNFGDGEFVYDIDNEVLHEYEAAGFYYVQCDVWDNVQAEFTSIANYFEITGETSGENNESSENGTGQGNGTGQNQTIHYNLENIVATCSGGIITSDEYFGGRAIECENASSGAKLNIEAWDKPNSANPQYFEMYKKSQIGNGLEICIADTCISSSGFAKSSDYPIISNATLPEENETEPDNETEPPINETNETGLFIYSENELIVQYICKPEGSSDDLVVDWNFGDGEFVYDIDNEVLHEYEAAGFYYVQCDVWDNVQAEFTSIANYFEITGETSGENNESVLNKPVWLSHSGTANVAVDYFHFEVNEAQNKSRHYSTDWEVWSEDYTDKVWSFYEGIEMLRYHVHTPDGEFVGSLSGESQLNYGTNYAARAKFTHVNGTETDWSEWRTFSTAPQQNINESAPTWTAAPGFSVEKFAEGFDVPVHVVGAPDIYGSITESERPFLYVTELYGKIKVVYQNGSQSVYADNLLNFNPFGSITGGGQMGVVGLVVDPVTGDLFASMVYLDETENNTVKNKVVRFYSSEDGKTFTSSEIILDDLPSAPSHQAEQLTIHNAKLYLNLGDAQDVSSVQSDSVLVGKIISMNFDGSDVQVYAKGFRNPFGGDWSNSGTLYVTDNAPDVNDRLVKVTPGENYGWGMNDNFATFNEKRIATLNVSPVDVEFNYDSEFDNELYGRLYVAVAGPIYQKGPTNGKEILEFTLNSNGEVENRRNFVYYTGSGYGTPMGLEFHKGDLYFTDIYGEVGFVGLGESEGNIYRVVKGESSENQTQGEFRAGLSVIPWYPKDTGNGIEYIFECVGIDGSGEYKYNFDFGDEVQTGSTDWNTQYHKYPYGNQEYNVTCNVEDLVTFGSAMKSIIVNPDNFIEE